MTDQSKHQTNSETLPSIKESDIEKILKAIQKNLETNPQFKAQFQNLCNIKSEPETQIKSEIGSFEEDSDESLLSENKDNSDNGKTSLADKVKRDLANINSKLIKKKSITKKRWWTPEEVAKIL